MPAPKPDDDDVDVTTLRKHAWHFLEPEVARSVGITLAQLQQFVAGHFHPDRTTLRRLSRRIYKGSA